MAPFGRTHTSCYSSSIAAKAVFCIISEIKRDIGRKSRLFHTPPAFDASVKGDPVRISSYCSYKNKLEWCSYQLVKKFEDMFTRFDIIPGTWAWQTTRHCAIARIVHSVAWQKSKKWPYMQQFPGISGMRFGSNS